MTSTDNSVNVFPDRISQLERLTAALHQDEDSHSLSLALSHAVEGIVKMDIEGRFIWVNAAYCSISGYLPYELIGKTCEEVPGIVIPDDSEKLRQANAALIKLGSETVELRGIRRNKEKYWKRVTLVPAYDRLGRLIGQFRFVQDITHRKNNDEQTRRLYDKIHNREQRLSAMLDVIQAAIVTVDAAGVVTDWNRKAIDMFGYSVSEAVGQPFTELVALKNSTDPAVYVDFLANNEQDPRLKMTPLRRRDENEFMAELTISSWEDSEHKKFSTLMIRDLSFKEPARQAALA